MSLHNTHSFLSFGTFGGSHSLSTTFITMFTFIISPLKERLYSPSCFMSSLEIVIDLLASLILLIEKNDGDNVMCSLYSLYIGSVNERTTSPIACCIIYYFII